jgi:hypothetical protein
MRMLPLPVRVAYLSAPSPRWISPRSQMVVPVGGQQGELVDWLWSRLCCCTCFMHMLLCML